MFSKSCLEITIFSLDGVGVVLQKVADENNETPTVNVIAN